MAPLLRTVAWWEKGGAGVALISQYTVFPSETPTAEEAIKTSWLQVVVGMNQILTVSFVTACFFLSFKHEAIAEPRLSHTRLQTRRF